MKDQQWLHEFSEFMESENASIPAELDLKLQKKMKALLEPIPALVFGKVLTIHLGVGLLSLAFCHQFGLNPFQTDFSIDAWFMHFGGHNFCMIACGFLFVALSILAASYWLTIEEFKALRRNGLLQSLSLSLVSLCLFHFFGADLVLGMAGLWLLGALMAGFLTTEAIWRVRTA